MCNTWRGSLTDSSQRNLYKFLTTHLLWSKSILPLRFYELIKPQATMISFPSSTVTTVMHRMSDFRRYCDSFGRLNASPQYGKWRLWFHCTRSDCVLELSRNFLAQSFLKSSWGCVPSSASSNVRREDQVGLRFNRGCCDHIFTPRPLMRHEYRPPRIMTLRL